MMIGGVDYLSVLVAAIAGWAVGAAWYGALSKPWLAAVGKTREELMPGGRTNPTPFIISFVAELVMAWVLAAVISASSPTEPGILAGMAVGALCWLGFIATTMVTNNAYAGRKEMLTVIDAGHWLAVAVVMGGVIGAF